MPTLTMRYDLRQPSFSPVAASRQYSECLEQATWADRNGFDTIVLSEHHGLEDGYLPAPLVMAAAIAGRTTRTMISIAALLVPLHDPLGLAEDIAVLDLASQGRITIVAGIGYRDEECEMFGVDRKTRGSRAEEHLRVMIKAWSGEPFEFRGTTVVVRPRPFRQPHPILLVGGSTEIAARRAAKLHLPFMPAIADQALSDVYAAECQREGFAAGWVLMPSRPGFVHVTRDPEKAWAQILPHAAYDAQTYAAWQKPGMRSAVTTYATTPEQLKASGVYAVVTPEECVELANNLGPSGSLVFHPLMGGMAPELGWESLELFASEVLPKLAAPS